MDAKFPEDEQHSKMRFRAEVEEEDQMIEDGIRLSLFMVHGCFPAIESKRLIYRSATS